MADPEFAWLGRQARVQFGFCGPVALVKPLSRNFGYRFDFEDVIYAVKLGELDNPVVHAYCPETISHVKYVRTFFRKELQVIETVL